MQPFGKLYVRHEGRRVVNRLYDLTDDFPDHERFGFTAQIRRAGVSVVANVAEVTSRVSHRDFARFLEIAVGSANEVHCLLRIASDRGYVPAQNATELVAAIRSLRAQLVRLQQSVRSQARSDR